MQDAPYLRVLAGGTCNGMGWVAGDWWDAAQLR